MRRPRPHTPLRVRCQVALRQIGWGHDALEGRGAAIERLLSYHKRGSKELLRLVLNELAEKLGCAVGDLRLDHNPALGLRPYNPRVKDVAARYKPNANDPDAMLYRSAHAHHIKTNVRGDGAQRSDIAQMKRERQRAKKRKGKKRSRRGRSFVITAVSSKGPLRVGTRLTYSSRWPRGRKIRSRGFPKGKRPFQRRRKP